LAVVHRLDGRWNWQAVVLAGMLSAVAIAPGPARAGGLFDFLFGGFQDRGAPQPPAASYAEPSAPVAPAPLGCESVRQGGGGTGRVIAYCVRLCDGQHFPLEHLANATLVETCRAMCPASKTKIFFGSEIGGATAKDGARYADLDTAFTYRKQLVANCTCNGKDAFGLAPFDLSSDPTLRPGDIVATKQGLMAYTGRNGAVAAFTPVDRSSVADQLNSITSRVQVSRRGAPKAANETEQASAQNSADDDPGTIAQSRVASPPVNLGANARGPVTR
jgi:hypothetical protein